MPRAACLGEIFRERFPDKEGWEHLVERFGLPESARDLHTHDLTAWWDLVLARLSTSVLMAAQARTASPEDEYLQVTDEPARRLLRRIAQ